MASKEITLWIDEHWYNALNKHLKGETLEEHMEDVLDELCNKLPENEYTRISNLIYQEKMEQQREREAARRFVVFKVTEDERTTHFLVEENMDVVQVAKRLRDYTRKEPTSFVGTFSRGERISKEKFYDYVRERRENPVRVVGAYSINLDTGLFEHHLSEEGWLCYRIEDVSTAVYFATKKSNASKSEALATFAEHLQGQQLTDEDFVP